jgi:hypothetical protein
MSRTFLVLATSDEHEQHALRSAIALRYDASLSVLGVNTACSNERSFSYSAAVLRHARKTDRLGSVGTIRNPKEHGCRSRHRSSAPVAPLATPSTREFRKKHRAQSAHSSITVTCFGTRGAGSRTVPKLSTSRLKHGVLPTGEIDKHRLRHGRYSPCFPRSSITRVVIGTARCHDYGRTFSGFGANERRVQGSKLHRLDAWWSILP